MYFADDYCDVRTVTSHGGSHSVSRCLPFVHPGVDSKILSKIPFDRVHFDPANSEHVKAFFTFRKTGKWTMKFHNEFPFTDVVATITDKILKNVESTVS
jgi:hypothetical protein